MPSRWTIAEEDSKRNELVTLYVKGNKTLNEVAQLLRIAPATVYDRLLRLGVAPAREKKVRYNNQRADVILPRNYSAELAEFVGIMLGDGNLTPTQVAVTLGSKDVYVPHVTQLMKHLFGIAAKTMRTKQGHQTVYFGSVRTVRWLRQMGLVHNKVKMQVDLPRWILSEKRYMRAALRGLMDTDGSIYRLKWGVQLSFCNHSIPLLESVRLMFIKLGFHISEISGHNVYLTRKREIVRFLKEIGFANKKHLQRYRQFGCVA